MRKILATVGLAVVVGLAAAPPAAAVFAGCTVVGSNGPDVIYSGHQPDQTLCGWKGADLLNAGSGRHEILRGGRGGDILNTQGCEDACRANCGPGIRDVAYIDHGQRYSGCERVHYDPPPIGKPD